MNYVFQSITPASAALSIALTLGVLVFLFLSFHTSQGKEIKNAMISLAILVLLIALTLFHYFDWRDYVMIVLDTEATGDPQTIAETISKKLVSTLTLCLPAGLISLVFLIRSIKGIFSKNALA